MNAENLIEPEAREQILAAISAMHDVKMSAAEFLQTQGHARHRAHESGIHHGAILQVDHELAISAIDHFPSELFQAPAVEETALALNLHPNGWTVYAY